MDQGLFQQFVFSQNGQYFVAGSNDYVYIIDLLHKTKKKYEPEVSPGIYTPCIMNNKLLVFHVLVLLKYLIL